MSKDTVVAFETPGTSVDLLTEVILQGAHKLLAIAVEAEVAEFMELYQEPLADGRRRFVRNGYLPE